MRRRMMKSKIHRATVTDANLHYVGSITVDRELMELADLYEYEQVAVVDIDNGARLETYVIEGHVQPVETVRRSHREGALRLGFAGRCRNRHRPQSEGISRGWSELNHRASSVDPGLVGGNLGVHAVASELAGEVFRDRAVRGVDVHDRRFVAAGLA